MPVHTTFPSVCPGQRIGPYLHGMQGVRGSNPLSYKRTRTVGAGSFEFSVAELGGDVFTQRRPRKPVIIEKSFAGMRGISPFQGSNDRMIGWGQPLIPIVGTPESCVDRWGWLGRPGTKTVSCP